MEEENALTEENELTKETVAKGQGPEPEFEGAQEAGTVTEGPPSPGTENAAVQGAEGHERGPASRDRHAEPTPPLRREESVDFKHYRELLTALGSVFAVAVVFYPEVLVHLELVASVAFWLLLALWVFWEFSVLRGIQLLFIDRFIAPLRMPTVVRPAGPGRPGEMVFAGGLGDALEKINAWLRRTWAWTHIEPLRLLAGTENRFLGRVVIVAALFALGLVGFTYDSPTHAQVSLSVLNSRGLRFDRHDYQAALEIGKVGLVERYHKSGFSRSVAFEVLGNQAVTSGHETAVERLLGIGARAERSGGADFVDVVREILPTGSAATSPLSPSPIDTPIFEIRQESGSDSESGRPGRSLFGHALHYENYAAALSLLDKSLFDPVADPYAALVGTVCHEDRLIAFDPVAHLGLASSARSDVLQESLTGGESSLVAPTPLSIGAWNGPGRIERRSEERAVNAPSNSEGGGTLLVARRRPDGLLGPLHAVRCLSREERSELEFAIEWFRPRELFPALNDSRAGGAASVETVFMRVGVNPSGAGSDEHEVHLLEIPNSLDTRFARLASGVGLDLSERFVVGEGSYGWEVIFAGALPLDAEVPIEPLQPTAGVLPLEGPIVRYDAGPHFVDLSLSGPSRALVAVQRSEEPGDGQRWMVYPGGGSDAQSISLLPRDQVMVVRLDSSESDLELAVQSGVPTVSENDQKPAIVKVGELGRSWSASLQGGTEGYYLVMPSEELLDLIQEGNRLRLTFSLSRLKADLDLAAYEAPGGKNTEGPAFRSVPLDKGSDSIEEQATEHYAALRSGIGSSVAQDSSISGSTESEKVVVDLPAQGVLIQITGYGVEGDDEASLFEAEVEIDVIGASGVGFQRLIDERVLLEIIPDRGVREATRTFTIPVGSPGTRVGIRVTVESSEVGAREDEDLDLELFAGDQSLWTSISMGRVETFEGVITPGEYLLRIYDANYWGEGADDSSREDGDPEPGEPRALHLLVETVEL